MTTSPKNPSRHSRPSLQFSLSMLLLSITAAAIILAGLYHPPRYDAVAYLEVRGSFGSGPSFPPSWDRRSFEQRHAACVRRLRSEEVLKAALQRPRVASLSIVKSQDDPLRWLTESLVLRSSIDSPIIEASIAGRADEAQDKCIVLDSVIGEFLDAMRKDEDLKAAEEQRKLQRELDECGANLKAMLTELSSLKASEDADADERRRSLQRRIYATEETRDELMLRVNVARVHPSSLRDNAAVRVIQPAISRVR